MCNKQLTESSPKDTKVALCSDECMEDFCLLYKIIWLLEPTLIGVSIWVMKTVIPYVLYVVKSYT